MRLNEHCYYVYMLTNSSKKVLYTGVTNDLSYRLIQHYSGRGSTSSFTGRFYCYWLVFYEECQYIYNAIAREKEIKGWTRKKKDDLITSFNPTWLFLNSEVCGIWPPEQSMLLRE